MSARFSGRTAFDVFGGCVGLGDSFDLAIVAAPVVRGGAIGFKDVKVSTTKDSYLHPPRAGRADAGVRQGCQDRRDGSGAKSSGAGARGRVL